MKALLDVVIITYNSSRTIVKLLNSFLNETTQVKKIIVLENKSPDSTSTEKVVKNFAKSHRAPGIQFIKRKKNYGFANSCNYGAELSDSKYVLFLNPDTELRIDSLSKLLKHAVNTKADIVGGKAVNYQKKPHGSVVRKPNLFIGLFEFTNLGKLFNINKAHEQFYYEDVDILKSKVDKGVDAISGAYLLVKKKSFEKLGGFDENFFMYLEDVDLGKRANDMGMKVIFCPHSVIWHEGGASSNNKYRIRHQAWFDSRKYYFRKHFGLLTNLIIQPIFSIEELLLKRIKRV